jgi:hypothetical protein
MADRSASLEHLLVREIERRLELERYCSSLEAELFSLAAQLRHEKLNNITLRHMVINTIVFLSSARERLTKRDRYRFQLLDTIR